MRRVAKVAWILLGLWPVLGGAEPLAQPLVLTLEECIARTLKNNPQMVIAEHKIEAAQGQAQSAKANRYPQVTWSATVVRSNMLMEFATGEPTVFPLSQPVANPEGDPAPVAPHTHLMAFPGFEISSTREGNIYMIKWETALPLYTGGKLSNGIEAAALEVRAAEEGLKNQKLNLVYQVEQVFYGALLADEMVKVIEEAIKTAQARYKWIQDLYEEGMVSNLDLLQVESMVASLDPQRIEAKNQAQLARVGLKAMMDLDPEIPLELAGKLEYKPEPLPTLEEVLAEAMRNRPDLRSLDVRRAQADKMVQIAKAGYMPTVAAFANYQANMGQEMPPNDKLWRTGWQAGVNLSMPLFDGGKTWGELKSAQSQYAQVEEGRRGLELMVQTEAESALLNIKKAEEQVAARKVAVEAAQKNFQVAEDRYRVGLANNLEVMDAEMELTKAQAEYLAGVYEYIMAQANLRKVTGRAGLSTGEAAGQTKEEK